MVAPLVAMAAADAAKDPQVQKILIDLANQPDRPLYTKRWINADGLEESLSVTPRSLIFLGGGLLLAAVAWVLYKFMEENHKNWLMGGLNVWNLIDKGISASAGVDKVVDVARGALDAAKDAGDRAQGVAGDIADENKKTAQKAVSWLKGLF